MEVGLEELFQHRIGTDWPYVLSRVFRAMDSASETKRLHRLRIPVRALIQLRIDVFRCCYEGIPSCVKFFKRKPIVQLRDRLFSCDETDPRLFNCGEFHV